LVLLWLLLLLLLDGDNAKGFKKRWCKLKGREDRCCFVDDTVEREGERERFEEEREKEKRRSVSGWSVCFGAHV
jgi:hypothetical protein